MGGVLQDICHVQISVKYMGPKREGRVGRGSLLFGQDADNILCSLAKIGGVGDFWEVKRLWEELDSACVPSGCSGRDVAFVTALVVGGGSNVPTVYIVG